MRAVLPSKIYAVSALIKCPPYLNSPFILDKPPNVQFHPLRTRLLRTNIRLESETALQEISSRRPNSRNIRIPPPFPITRSNLPSLRIKHPQRSQHGITP